MIPILVAAALAAQSTQGFQLYTAIDSDSCATWTSDRKNRGSQVLQGWLLGLITGYNYYKAPSGNIAPGVTTDGLFGWVDQYCAANPLDSVTTASFKLIKELERRAH